jgi:two-component system nitrogen regulation sensor histidine kinase NtrY
MMENITAGVVSLDTGGRVLLRNRVATQLLGAEVGEELASALARSASLRPVAAWLERGGGELRAGTARVAGADGAERDWSVVWVPLPEGGEPSALLVVEDVTEVLRGQRLQAWAEMARIIAHEIKNPLTPIKLSAEHMRQVYASDPEHFDAVFESCTANILRQVEELRQISSEFSTYSHIPRFEPKPGDLVGSLARVVESYQAAPAAGVRVTFRSESARLEARYDERLLGRAIRNLLENAMRAVAGGGAVEVSLSAADSTVRIAVADSGPGVPPEILARIFDPYFSTHAGGTGLGLPIARRIAEEHGGTIAARNRDGGGLEVSIALPAAGTPS